MAKEKEAKKARVVKDFDKKNMTTIPQMARHFIDSYNMDINDTTLRRAVEAEIRRKLLKTPSQEFGNMYKAGLRRAEGGTIYFPLAFQTEVTKHMQAYMRRVLAKKRHEQSISIAEMNKRIEEVKDEVATMSSDIFNYGKPPQIDDLDATIALVSSARHEWSHQALEDPSFEEGHPYPGEELLTLDFIDQYLREPKKYSIQLRDNVTLEDAIAYDRYNRPIVDRDALLAMAETIVSKDYIETRKKIEDFRKDAIISLLLGAAYMSVNLQQMEEDYVLVNMTDQFQQIEAGDSYAMAKMRLSDLRNYTVSKDSLDDVTYMDQLKKKKLSLLDEIREIVKAVCEESIKSALEDYWG